MLPTRLSRSAQTMLLAPLAVLLALGCHSSSDQGGDTTAITGTRIDTWHTLTTGDVARPADLSAVAIAALVPDGAGGYVTTAGAGKVDGTYRIPTKPAGFYWLKLGTTYLWTDKEAVAWGMDRIGRPDATPPSSETDLTITAPNLMTWDLYTDTLLFYNYNTDAYAYDLTNGSLRGAPGMGDTLLNGLTVDWNALYAAPAMNDSTKGDHPYVIQMGGLDTAQGSVRVAMRVLEPSAYTQATGLPAATSGTFAAIPQNRTFRCNVKASEFTPAPALVGSRAEINNQWLTLAALKGAATYGAAGYSGDLLDAWPTTSTATDFDLGDVAYGNPYPSGWDTLVMGSTTYDHTFTLGAGAPWYLYTSVYLETIQQPTATSPLRPLVGLVKNPTLNGRNLLSDLNAVGTTPTLAWQAPDLGTPTGYLVRIYRMSLAGADTTGTLVAELMARTPTMKVPPGVLQAGGTYVLMVRSIAQATDLTAAPNAYVVPFGAAELASGLIQP